MRRDREEERKRGNEIEHEGEMERQHRGRKKEGKRATTEWRERVSGGDME